MHERSPSLGVQDMGIRLMIALLLAVIVIVSGCGGDDTDATDIDTTDTDTGDTTEAEAADAAPPAAASSDASAGAPGTGTITVGDQTFELEVVRCVTLAGAIGAEAVAVDEPDNVSVSISLSPDDWRDRPASEGWTANGSLRLDIEEPYQQWEAGVEAVELYNLPDGLTPEDFAIASYVVSDDGQSAKGEAAFVSVDSLLRTEGIEPTPGSFAVTCPES
jgi:hypothetical protein